MPNTPLVSVIIPIYNVKSYLDNCIESVVKQSYAALEILLVDDGSTDGSSDVCDAWAKKDIRIRVIHKTNAGLNDARRTGWESSTGAYVTFLDADDFFRRDNIEKSYTALAEANADIAAYSFEEFSDKTEDDVSNDDTSATTRILKGKDQIARYILLGVSNFPSMHHMTVWGKLYKRELVKRVDWDVSNYLAFEDNFWTPQVFLPAQKVVLMSDKLVFYRRNFGYGVSGGSTLSSKLMGNASNGEPVGYIELIYKMEAFYQGLVKKYGLDRLQEGLTNILYINKISRLDSLIQSGLLGEENNLAYIKLIWDEHKARDTLTQSEIARLHAEIMNLRGIRASIRSLGVGIRRRIRRK